MRMIYHQLGADDWAAENLTLLAEKYPTSKAAADGRTLLAKLGGSKSGTTVAKGQSSSPFSDSRSYEAPTNTPSLLTPPSAASALDALKLPSANALGQSFTVCRLGAWC